MFRGLYDILYLLSKQHCFLIHSTLYEQLFVFAYMLLNATIFNTSINNNKTRVKRPHLRVYTSLSLFLSLSPTLFIFVCFGFHGDFLSSLFGKAEST